MKQFLALILLAACVSAGAEVFRHVGPDGTVTFSDTPSPDAERVNVAPAQTVSVPPVSPRAARVRRPGGNDGDGSGSAPAYSRFAITAPSDGQSVRANDGSVTVSLLLEPALAPGHTIELILDGEDGGQVYSGSRLTFNLSNLSRGEHRLLARVKNAKGEQFGETGAVSFYVLRVARGG
jgi:hypothetical protein